MQNLTGLVVTNQADKNALRAKRGDIAGDVAGAPDFNGVVLDLQNRRRRFGRNARDIAIDKIVKHDVADTKNGLLADEPPPRDPLPITIGAIQIAGHVLFDPVFQSSEIGVKAGAAQIFGLGLGKILISSADRLRHFDVFDVRLAA